MRSHKTDSFKTFNLLYFHKKLCKRHWLVKSFSVRIYILSKEHNFYNSICYHTFNFTDNRLWITASFSSSYIWYNTITAEIITTEHNIDSGFK